MAYIDGCIIAVPSDKKDAYIVHARAADVIFKELGALEIVDSWGDDIPDGKVTDFKRAVQATADETVVFSWIRWPDKATRDMAWKKAMEDERMKSVDMPFDGKRMVFGGFEVILEA